MERKTLNIKLKDSIRNTIIRQRDIFQYVTKWKRAGHIAQMKTIFQYVTKWKRAGHIAQMKTIFQYVTKWKRAGHIAQMKVSTGAIRSTE